jgi:hypothetical protein
MFYTTHNSIHTCSFVRGEQFQMAGLTLRIDFATMASALQLVADNTVIPTNHQIKRSVNMQQRSKAGRSEITVYLLW